MCWRLTICTVDTTLHVGDDVFLLHYWAPLQSLPYFWMLNSKVILRGRWVHSVRPYMFGQNSLVSSRFCSASLVTTGGAATRSRGVNALPAPNTLCGPTHLAGVTAKAEAEARAASVIRTLIMIMETQRRTTIPKFRKCRSIGITSFLLDIH